MADFTFVVVARANQFEFVVDAETEMPTAQGVDINVFNRYTASNDINLDGRLGPIGVEQQPAAEFGLLLSASPSAFALNAATVVSLYATRNGQAQSGVVISVATTNAAIGLVPDQIFTTTDGRALFSLIGLQEGSATITASMVIDGVTTSSNAVGITVTAMLAPTNWNATGYGRVVMTIESPLVNGLHARVERLSHAEQTRKYPTDKGLEYASYFDSQSGKTVTFIPAFLRQQ